MLKIDFLYNNSHYVMSDDGTRLLLRPDSGTEQRTEDQDCTDKIPFSEDSGFRSSPAIEKRKELLRQKVWNIMLVQPDWSDEHLIYYFRKCIRELERESGETLFSPDGTAVLCTALYRAAVMSGKAQLSPDQTEEPDSERDRTSGQDSDQAEAGKQNPDRTSNDEIVIYTDEELPGLWIDFSYFLKKILDDSEEAERQIFENQEHLKERVLKVHGLCSDGIRIQLFPNLIFLCTAQFQMMALLPFSEIEKASGNEERFRWVTLKQEAQSCLTFINRWIEEESRENTARQESIVKPVVERCRTFLKEWNPEKIYAYLDEYISGQEKAKTEWAHLSYEHAARIANPELKIRKSNYVMYGPTGCGKTEIARVIRDILPVPVEIVDASVITGNGFKGPDKEEVMFELAAQDKDLEYGIVVLDEFDKLCVPSHDSAGSNVNKLIQGELLKMIEGTMLYQYKGIEKGKLDTGQITFICAGAFEGAFRKEWKNAFGFGGKAEDLRGNRSALQCLEEYGMIPELAGRICSLIPIDPLDETNLYEILTDKKNNCIDNIRKLYRAAYDSDIEFSDEAIREICHCAAGNGLGARGLESLVGSVCRTGRGTITNDTENVLRITRKTVQDACV